MDDGDRSRTVQVGVGVLVGRRPVCTPAGVADPDRPREVRTPLEGVPEGPEFAGAFEDAECLPAEGDARRIVPAVFELREAVNQRPEGVITADTADDPSHQRTTSVSSSIVPLA